jgi:ferredoxin
MKIKVDFTLCEANGSCVVEAPELFDLDENEELVVLDWEPGPEQREEAQAAARSCPRRAIQIEE